MTTHIYTRFKREKQFIINSKLTHNNKYDYSLVNYINIKTKVQIICPIHGIFEQRPSNHLDHKGCLKCAIDNKMGIYNFTTLHRNPQLANKNSTLYMIEHQNLYKIGITTQNIFKRFKKSINIIHLLENIPLIKSYNIEQQILTKFNHFKEKPKNWYHCGDNEFLNINNTQRNQIIIDYFK